MGGLDLPRWLLRVALIWVDENVPQDQILGIPSSEAGFFGIHNLLPS